MFQMFWFVYKFVSNQKRAWEGEGSWNLWTLGLVVEEREEMAEACHSLSPLSSSQHGISHQPPYALIFPVLSTPSLPPFNHV